MKKDKGISLIVGISVIVSILVGSVVFLFVRGMDRPQSTQQTDQVNTNADKKEKEEQKKEGESKEKWGTECWKDVVTSKGIFRIYVSFPDRTGLERWMGLLSEQPDKTMTAFDVYHKGISPEVDDIKEMFPAYSEQMMGMFRDAYGLHYDNNTLDVELNGTETIGSYEVTKFKGIHKYTREGWEYNSQIVIYAVELKAGAYAYVMVQDNSEEQSQLKLIEGHAYNMIKSIREEK